MKDKLVFWSLVIGFALVCYTEAKAEVYFGAGASVSVVDLDTNCNGCTTYDNQKVSLKPTGFIGFRYHNTAIESGIGYADFRSHAVLPSRPADMRQEIDSRYLSFSAVQFFPVSKGEFFGGAGVARVWASNYEHGLNRNDQTNIPAGYMENRTWTKEIAPFIQAGWQGENIRIGVSFIPNVVRSVWTRSEDIYNVSASYVWRWK